MAGAPVSALTLASTLALDSDSRAEEAVGLAVAELDSAGAALDSTVVAPGPVPLRWWQVPKEVRRNVRLAYPYRLYRDWAKEDSFYTVRVISVDYESAYFDSTGEWVRARRPMRLSELPYRTYLFIKEEFKAFRFIYGYRLQERDDLARYYVELEHKRIHSLKTYLEFDFFGTLTRLDGQPVGEEPEESSVAQEEWARLYAEVYDPEAEEAAYAEAAEVVADTVVEEAVLAVVAADTLIASPDTVALADTDTLSVQPHDTVFVALADTDTLPVQPHDTVFVALAADTALAVDTVVEVVADAAADTIAPLCPDIVARNFQKRFPGGRDAAWRQQDTLYVVSFNQYGKSVMAAFREDGFQIYTAYGMERKELPLPIDNYLKTSAKGMKLEEGRRVAYEAKYRRLFSASERPKDYYYVIMSRKQPKGKQRQYIRFVFNQNAQFESQSSYDAYQSGK